MEPSLTSGSFLSPRIIFGLNSIEKIGELLNEIGARNYFLVSDEVLKNIGIVDKVLKNLSDLNGDVFIVKPREPYIEDAEEIADKARKGSYEVVVGIGGGSVLDLAKTAAMARKNLKPIPEYLGRNKVKNKGVPMILIPTTSGTGSEVSQAIVLSEPDGVKVAIWDPKVLPDVALVDPVLTSSMPPKVTASSGLDALSHAIEALMSKHANPITDGLAVEAIRLIFKYLPGAFVNGQSMEARYNMSLAALMAGLAFSNSSLTAGHAISYTYSHKYRVPHGIACGLALPYIMIYNTPAIMDKFILIAKAIGERAENPFDATERVVRRVLDLIKMVKMPTTLKEIGVAEGELSEFVNDLFDKYSRLLPYNPRELTRDDALAIFKMMWEGKLVFL